MKSSSYENMDGLYTLLIPNCGADKQAALSGGGLRTGGYVQQEWVFRNMCHERKETTHEEGKTDVRYRRVALQVLQNHITQLGFHCIPRHFCVEGGDSIWHALSEVGDLNLIM